MDKTILSVKNLCAGYDNKEILHRISLNFDSGKVIAIVGPNGCGKSTLLKTLIGLVPKTDGDILCDGAPADSLTSAQRARKIAYLPQSKNIPDLSVMTMVLHGRFAYLGYPRRYRKEDISAAENALRITELSQYANENISTLSGGTQQRVFLAMALAQDSPVILMDEPNSFMDISYQIKFMKLCRHLADEGKTIVMVLHDLPTALKYADEIAVMSGGEMISCGTPDEIYNSSVLDRVFAVTIKKIQTDEGIHYYY